MLKVDIVTKYYKEHIGIEKLDLEVQPGEIVGILGANGSGKTTLFKAIMNLIDINIGDVTIDGEPVCGDVYNKLAYITEEGSYFNELTPNEHGDFFVNLFDGFDIERFNKLLNFFELPIDKKTKALSKGQRSKLEIAIGFSKSAKYILMDEPFMGKDIFTRRDFMKLMIASLREDESIIIATHLIDEIQNLLTRVVVLENGRKKYDFKIEELEKQEISLLEFMKKNQNYREDRVSKIFYI